MRLAFMGTPDFAVPALEALIEAGHDVAAVYSQPPRPAGRGKGLRASPVQQRAEVAAIEVRTPLSLRGAEEQEAFRALGLDAAVVAAYGLILPQPILEAPRLGCLNVHASLLPRWRGAAPIQRAILAGDGETGVTIMQMERGLDTGPMLARWETPVDGKTAGALTEELAVAGGRLLAEVLADPGAFPPLLQPEEGVTYAPKVDKLESRLSFAGDSARQCERAVRAFNPAPGAWFEYAGERIKIHSAEVRDGRGEPGFVIDDALAIACAEGVLVPVSLQRAGRAPMTAGELLRGFPIPPGTRLA